jgi:arabinofuranosyltransferase
MTRRDRLAVLALSVPFLLLVRRFWFVCDDAYISFRYARHWVEGHGLRYNLGEQPPVEGYSNFLWVVLSAAFELVGFRPERWVPLVSTGCGLALLALVHRTLRTRLDVGAAPSFMATLALASFPPFALWSTSGLETMAFALALFIAFERLVLQDPPAPWTAALAAIAACLLRTEGIVWGVVIGVAGASRLLDPRGRARSLRPLTVYLGATGLVFLVYFLGRYAYHELPFPNAVYMKVQFGTDVLLRGYRYVATFFLAFLTPFLVLPAMAFSWRRRGLVTLPIALMAIAFPAYAIVVGGDWLAMGRFLVPAFAFWAVLSGIALSASWTRSTAARALSLGGVAVAIVVGLLPGWNIHPVPQSVRAQYHFRYFNPPFKSEYDRWRRQRDSPIEGKRLGSALKRISKPGDSLVIGEVGAVGYASGLFIYDRFGLVTRSVTLNPRNPDEPLRAPGHDGKVSRDFFLREQPTYIAYMVLRGPNLREAVLSLADSWKPLHANTLWRTYVPDFVELDGKPDNEATEVVMVLRAVEEEADDPFQQLPRNERRRARTERAERLWAEFYERARRLPGATPVTGLDPTNRGVD